MFSKFKDLFICLSSSQFTFVSTPIPYLYRLSPLLRRMSPPVDNEMYGIREVWASNLDKEMATICRLVAHYPYVAMDTEFPGVVARPNGYFATSTDHIYHTMRVNVNLLKLIQLGLTLMDEEGRTPPGGINTWQFNFRFSLANDMYNYASINLLSESGLQFKKHEEEGIDPTEFAVKLTGSGVVLCENISWLSFHSGYDFGYLLRLLMGVPLPDNVSEFFELLNIYFPRIFDLKYIMKSTMDLKGGLGDVAKQLTLERKGAQHQAGSDSLLTGETFFRLRKLLPEENIEDDRFVSVIYGLRVNDYLYKGNTTLGDEEEEEAITMTKTTKVEKEETNVVVVEEEMKLLDFSEINNNVKEKNHFGLTTYDIWGSGMILPPFDVMTTTMFGTQTMTYTSELK